LEGFEEGGFGLRDVWREGKVECCGEGKIGREGGGIRTGDAL